jgi:hypothetical protein
LHTQQALIELDTGGLLADPVTQWPRVFGPGSLLGGETGVQWMIDYPYALPNLLSACFLLSSALVVILGLEEVSVTLFEAEPILRSR